MIEGYIIHPKIVFVANLIYYLIILGVVFLVYKKTTKEFHKFTKNRVIASAIIFFIFGIRPYITQIYDFIIENGITLPHDLSPGLAILSAIEIILGQIIIFYSIYLFVCSLIFCYYAIQKKDYKTQNMSIITPILYLIFFIIFVIILYPLLLIGVMTVLNPLLFYPCGVEIIKIEPNSPVENSGLSVYSIITKIDSLPTNNSDDLIRILNTKRPNQKITIFTDQRNYELLLVEHPDNISKAYIGASLKTKICEK